VATRNRMLLSRPRQREETADWTSPTCTDTPSLKFSPHVRGGGVGGLESRENSTGRTGPMLPRCRHRTDPNAAKLEPDRGLPHRLGDAPDDGGVNCGSAVTAPPLPSP